MLKTDQYNYERFKPAHYDFYDFAGPRPGEKFLDFKAYTLEGIGVRLSDFIGKTIVLETGSVTCPLYAQSIDRMNKFTKKHPETLFLLLYVREAHPGSDTPCHHNRKEKIRQAKRLYDEYEENRLVLVDDVQGHAHQKYGGLPNMVYVINKEGTVVFRNDWKDIDALQTVLEDETLNDLYFEDHNEPKVGNAWLALKVLLKGGWDAVWDMLTALPTLRKLHQKARIRYLNRRFV